MAILALAGERGVLFPFAGSRDIAGLCKGDNGCTGCNERMPYELCVGTGLPPLVWTGLASRKGIVSLGCLMGDVGLVEYVDMLIALALRDDVRLTMVVCTGDVDCFPGV